MRYLDSVARPEHLDLINVSNTAVSFLSQMRTYSKLLKPQRSALSEIICH
jgi:hypothetical protein